MTPRTPHWEQTVEACGLALVDKEVPPSLPSVMTAVYAATGIDVKPTERVPNSPPDSKERLGDRWQAVAVEAKLMDTSKEFHIIPPGGGGTSVGWVRVMDVSSEPLPSRVASVTGSPELVALSLDGRRLLAVTEEDDEYWIVIRTFD